MVRRDEPKQLKGSGGSGCTSPAGESPAPVIAGEPGSRSTAHTEMGAAEAGRRKPLRREQQRGPQHQVKPAASKDLQRESRTAHVTVKATSRAPKTGDVRARDLSGVRGAARVEGEVRNTGGPSAQLLSQRGGSYKPKVKSSAVQRKSEGIVVLRMGAKNNASGGKGPCGGRDGGEGKREGMTGPASRSNSPERQKPIDKVVHSVSRRCVTAWCKRQRSSYWSRCSKPTSTSARTGSSLAAEQPGRWKCCARARTTTCSMRTSGTSSARWIIRC